MKLSIAAGLTALATLIGAGSAMAAPVGLATITGSTAGSNPLVVQIHGCHRSAQDDIRGWHRHVGPNCRRIHSSPEEQNPYARCRTKCNYVGPIKQCRRICD